MAGFPCCCSCVVQFIDGTLASFLPAPWVVVSGGATKVSDFWQMTAETIIERDASTFASSQCTSSGYGYAPDIVTQWSLLLQHYWTHTSGSNTPEFDLSIELLDAGGTAIVTASAHIVNVPFTVLGFPANRFEITLSLTFNGSTVTRLLPGAVNVNQTAWLCFDCARLKWGYASPSTFRGVDLDCDAAGLASIVKYRITMSGQSAGNPARLRQLYLSNKHKSGEAKCPQCTMELCTCYDIPTVTMSLDAQYLPSLCSLLPHGSQCSYASLTASAGNPTAFTLYPRAIGQTAPGGGCWLEGEMFWGVDFVHWYHSTLLGPCSPTTPGATYNAGTIANDVRWYGYVEFNDGQNLKVILQVTAVRIATDQPAAECNLNTTFNRLATWEWLVPIARGDCPATYVLNTADANTVTANNSPIDGDFDLTVTI